jgi:hypothetical protein
LKQNQKNYRHKNLVNGRKPNAIQTHCCTHIQCKIQNQTATKTHQSEKSFQLCDSASENN